MQNFGQTTPMWILRSAIRKLAWSSMENRLITHRLALINCLAMVRNTEVAVDETESLLTLSLLTEQRLYILYTFLVITLQVCRTNQELPTWTMNIFQGMHQTMLTLKKQLALHMKISQMVCTLDSKQYTPAKHNSKWRTTQKTWRHK